MPAPLTLQYGTYIFPNQTFEIMGHKLLADTPTTNIRRKDGGIVLNANLTPKKFQINGKVFSTDEDTLHAALNILNQAVHNKGQSGYLYYRADRRVLCRISQEGIDAPYEKGLNRFMANMNIIMVAERPFAESTTVRTVSGSRTNNANTDSVVNNGYYPTQPIFQFIAGADFLNNLFVMNLGNCNFFRWQGPIINGQTLLIDCDAGCVLLQVGATMVDAISYLAGDLLFKIEPGGTNTLLISGGTLSYQIQSRDRFYF